MAKISICFHIVFETNTSEKTLSIVYLIVLMDLLVPQIILGAFVVYIIICWTHLRVCKRILQKRDVYCNENSNDVIENQEFQPLLVT